MAILPAYWSGQQKLHQKYFLTASTKVCSFQLKDSLFVNLTIDKNKEKIILIDYKDQAGAHTKELKSIGVDLNNYNRISFIPGCAYFKKK